MAQPVQPEIRRDRTEVMARRRRMSRRSARRRVRKATVAGLVFVGLAMALRPESEAHAVPGVEGSSSFEFLGGMLRDHAIEEPGSPRQPGAGPRATSLRLPSLWKPAGDVLQRERAINSGPAPIFALSSAERDQRESLDRWHRIFTFSRRYRIRTDLARRIHDAAIDEGIEPELAFRLVRVESSFKTRAVSPAGAVGLTQLMLGTAREFEPDVTREDLMDPDINLRIGFRYLRTLIREKRGDLRLALIVYNRGPTAVTAALAMGVDPANGYEKLITRGYKGRGTLD